MDVFFFICYLFFILFIRSSTMIIHQEETCYKKNGIPAPIKTKIYHHSRCPAVHSALHMVIHSFIVTPHPHSTELTVR